MFSAKIIAGSKYKYTKLATYETTFPRFILAELNTHRMLSKNSASSRAIPFKKMVKAVRENPFIPIAWQRDHSGMQGTEYFTGWKAKLLTYLWLLASKLAIISAVILNKFGLTKQICNRILEPFMWHTVIITGTEWENFFALRAQDMAEIHMQKLAYLMLEAYNNYEFKELQQGEWHIPFGNQISSNVSAWIDVAPSHQLLGKDLSELKVKVATAMCARVSYTVVGEEGRPANYAKDIQLHDKLLSSGHMSPFEHCAQAGVDPHFEGVDTIWSGNFKNFTQYRKLLPNENKSDNRVKR